MQIGGATGLVGDPSGKTEERTPLGKEKAVDNVESLTRAVDGFVASALEYGSRRLTSSQIRVPSSIPKVSNNAEWLASLGLLEFLTKAGRHERVPTMISRDRFVPAFLSPQNAFSILPFCQRKDPHDLPTRHLLHRIHVPASSSIRLPLPLSPSWLHTPTWWF